MSVDYVRVELGVIGMSEFEWRSIRLKPPNTDKLCKFVGSLFLHFLMF